MTDEEITKNLTMIEYYKEQLASLDVQLQYIQAAIGEYQKGKMTIEQLEKQEGKTELLVPVASGVFVPASASNTDKVLIDIGAGIVAEKHTDDAVKKIDERIETLLKNQEKLFSMAQKIQQEAVELSQKTQEMMQKTEGKK